MLFTKDGAAPSGALDCGVFNDLVIVISCMFWYIVDQWFCVLIFSSIATSGV